MVCDLLLVNVGDHGICFPFFIIGRVNKPPLQLLAVFIGKGDKLIVRPVIIILLRIGIGECDRVAEIMINKEEVRRIGSGLRLIDKLFG